ncbi:MAG: family 1 encapsulin nanocompartment shell protein [Bacteroidales bacterium]
MDILRRSIAPISQDAWNEIEEQAKIIFTNILTARRFAEVEGPKGIDYGGINLGRLVLSDKKKVKDVRYGINKFLPLLEARKSFNMNIWELDNAVRGAEDIDLGPMENAAKEIAEFEEKVIYHGLKDAHIVGLKNSSDHDKMNFPEEGKDILRTVTSAIRQMNKASLEGPYSLVLGEEKWQNLMVHSGGYPLNRQVKDIIGGEIILNPHIDEGYLLSNRGGDFKLTLGQDLSIGYESHNDKKVQLYFTESFTFQVLEPAAVIVFE